MTTSGTPTVSASGKLALAEIRKSTQIRALLSVYERADSIIARRSIRCLTANVPDETTPAWTDQTGSEVSFNLPHLGELESREDYIRITGLNYHELSHVLFTPRKGSRKNDALYGRMDRSTPSGQEFQEAWNILEDQRIESMMLTRAASVEPYFTSAIINYIVADPAIEEWSFLLVYGRKYLGPEVLKAALANWGHDIALAHEGAAIIDQYRVLDLTDPQDLIQCIALSTRFMELLRKLKPPSPKGGEGDDQQQGSGSGQQQGQSQDGAEGQQGVKGLPHGTKPHGGADQDRQGKRMSQDASQGVKDGKDRVRGRAKPGQGNQPAQGVDQGDGDQEQGDQEGGLKAGTEAGVRTEAGTDLDGLLAALLERASNSMIVETEYGTYRANFKAGRITPELKDYPYWTEKLIAEETGLTRQVSKELMRTVEQTDPGWLYREPAGTLNVSRWALGERSMDEMFDDWQEGQVDATSIEIVALLDISSSMGSHQNRLSALGYVCKRAADQIEVPCTIIAYDTQAFVVYKRDTKSTSMRFPGLKCTGGTNPTMALIEALTILSTTPHKKRYLLTMTDGEWSTALSYMGHHVTSDDLMAAINALPRCLTQMIYFDPNGNKTMTSVDWHGHKQRVLINDLSQLPQVFRSAVSALIAARR